MLCLRHWCWLRRMLLARADKSCAHAKPRSAGSSVSARKCSKIVRARVIFWHCGLNRSCLRGRDRHRRATHYESVLWREAGSLTIAARRPLRRL